MLYLKLDDCTNLDYISYLFIMNSEGINKPIFRDLQADDPDPETTEISSLCFNCGQDVHLFTLPSDFMDLLNKHLLSLGHDKTAVNQDTFL